MASPAASLRFLGTLFKPRERAAAPLPRTEAPRRPRGREDFSWRGAGAWARGGAGRSAPPPGPLPRPGNRNGTPPWAVAPSRPGLGLGRPQTLQWLLCRDSGPPRWLRAQERLLNKLVKGLFPEAAEQDEGTCSVCDFCCSATRTSLPLPS